MERKAGNHVQAEVKSREDLALPTPGRCGTCKVIAKDPEAAYKYTIKSNTIAVVSDGSAVLGLGNIGPPGPLCRSWKARRFFLK